MKSQILSGYSFPAIRGTQAEQDYFIVMCPLKRLKRIFTFDESELMAEDRAQRALNNNRVPQISKYIHDNRNSYAFSSLTACIEGTTHFEPINTNGHGTKIGTLFIDEDSDLYLTDGQHRNAAINKALEEDPSLGNETISVVFFVNKNLKQRQKIFRDLNLFPIPTSKSIAVLYGNSPEEQLSNKVAKDSSFFNGVIDFSDNRLSRRSAKLFMHSSLHVACLELCKGTTKENWEQQAIIAIDFWDELAANLPLWEQAKTHQIKSDDKVNYIIFSAILLKTFAQLGRELIANHNNWKSLLSKLQTINWERSNKIWSRRCVTNGRIEHSKTAAVLTLNALKHHIKLPLSLDQQKIENKFRESAK
ncbi:MAG: DNA sulfur modification protein DndB [Methyloprofundus sp.]|nr:DNA sulfur modification protein DndB [Methyloprofundus sp.]